MGMYARSEALSWMVRSTGMEADMNPWHLSSSELMIWGLVLHLVADWLFQSEWMAVNKMKRGYRKHTFINYIDEVRVLHGGMKIVSQERRCSFCGVPELKVDGIPCFESANKCNRHPAAYVHSGIHLVFLAVVFGWVALPLAIAHFFIDLRFPVAWWSRLINQTQPGQGSAPYDMGVEVRIWSDQVFHIVCIAVAALVVGS